MPSYLVFQLYGPMAAWGEIAVGETRRSALHPSKSAVMGLLAAALGIDRADDMIHASMSEAYGFAVKVLTPGSLLVDYHTIQVPPQKRKVVFRTRKDELTAEKLGTLLSSREYRCDTACLVAIWIAQETALYSLAELREALDRPKFTLYLGRKSCPLACRMKPEVRQFSTLKEALDSRNDFENKMARIDRRQNRFYYWDDTPHSGLEAQQRFERWDLTRSRQRWQFGPRKENFFVTDKEA